MAKDYEKVATKLKGLVGVGSVNCDEQKELCGTFGIKGFPTLKLFGAEVNKKGMKDPDDYQRARTAGAIASAGLSLLHGRNVQVAEQAQLDELLAGKKVAVLFSKKAQASNLLKALSMQFGKRLPFVLVPEKEGKEAAEKLGVTKYPTLLVTDDGASPDVYTGKLKIEAMTEFLDKHALPKPERRGGAGGGKSAPKPKPVEYDMKVEEIKTKEEWEKKCNLKAGLCAVAFLDPLEDEVRHAKFVAVLEPVLKKVYKNLRVMWVNAPDHYSFFENFRLGGGFPNFGLYQPKSKRVVPYRGSFTVEDILEWIEGTVLGGKPQSFSVEALEFK
jgi:protein disulfide-isomerase A6